jgi:predicted transposase YdaD
MLGTKAELKKTRFYQEVEEEILPRAVLPLLKSGMTVKAIAAELEVSVKRVNEFIKIAQAEK